MVRTLVSDTRDPSSILGKTTWPVSTMDSAIGFYPKGCGFDSHAGLFAFLAQW